MLEKTSYPELETAIAEQVEQAGLIYHPPWVLKLIQVSRLKPILNVLLINILIINVY